MWTSCPSSLPMSVLSNDFSNSLADAKLSARTQSQNRFGERTLKQFTFCQCGTHNPTPSLSPLPLPSALQELAVRGRIAILPRRICVRYRLLSIANGFPTFPEISLGAFLEMPRLPLYGLGS